MDWSSDLVQWLTGAVWSVLGIWGELIGGDSNSDLENTDWESYSNSLRAGDPFSASAGGGDGSTPGVTGQGDSDPYNSVNSSSPYAASGFSTSAQLSAPLGLLNTTDASSSIFDLPYTPGTQDTSNWLAQATPAASPNSQNTAADFSYGIPTGSSSPGAQSSADVPPVTVYDSNGNPIYVVTKESSGIIAAYPYDNSSSSALPTIYNFSEMYIGIDPPPVTALPTAAPQVVAAVPATVPIASAPEPTFTPTFSDPSYTGTTSGSAPISPPMQAANSLQPPPIDDANNDDSNNSAWAIDLRSNLVQGLGGLAAGTGIALVPGGFLAAPLGQATGLLKRPTRTFQFFEGAGEASTGIAQILGGIGGEVGGSGLDALGAVGAPETAGASLALTAGGLALNAASWGLILRGLGNVSTGFGTSVNALYRSRDEELPEGTHSIVDHPDQPVGTGSSTGPEILAENLERAGDARPSRYHEAHHIIPENDTRGELARDILKDAGIYINDAENGIWLERTSSGTGNQKNIPTTAFSSHDSIHTNVYYAEITQRLVSAQAADRVAEEMLFIKVDIEFGNFPE